MTRATLNSTPDGGDFARQRASFRLYLDAENKARSTIVTYDKALDQFVAYLAAEGRPLIVSRVRADDIRGFLVKLRDEGKAPATLSQRYRSLQAFFRYLVNEGRIDRSPFATLSPPSVPVQPPPVLTPDEIKRLLKAASGRTFEERRDHAIITLFADTGMRRAELSGLRLEDVDLSGVCYVVGKGDRGRWVPFGKTTARDLDRYLDARAHHADAGSEWLWLGQRGRLTDTGVEQMIKRRARQAGLVDANGKVKVHPHLFRHTAAHENLADGMNEGDLMAVMGWRNRQMVDRYGASAKAERARASQRQHSLMDRLAGSR